MNLPVIDPRCCPLCGRPNACARDGSQAISCWCFTTDIPPQLRQRLPPQLQDRVCICRRCAEALQRQQQQ